jgi:hypothetical protein
MESSGDGQERLAQVFFPCSSRNLMLDHPRPAFVWLVALLSVVYVASLAFATYAITSHYGVIKDPGWSVRPTDSGVVGVGGQGRRTGDWTG